jgi:arylsulfatase
MDETTDVGHDTASPVSDEYTPEESALQGRVDWVRIDVDDAVHADQEIPPEERLRIILARQ